MASELTTAAPHARAGGPPSAVAARVRELLPFRAVVLPWLVARLLVVPLLVLTAPAGHRSLSRLIWMDGQWFRLIAFDWYDRPYVSGRWSEYPFFPLFPALGGALMKVGFPPTVALTGVSWLAALAALAGAYRLAARHLPPAAVPWAPWFLAIGPGAVTMILGYSDSLYLAGLVWALVLAEDRRWWTAGLLAAVATASRPNGWIALVAVVATVLVDRAGRRALVAVALPSVAFLAAWATYLWWATDDPLVFWHAKAAWVELTLGALIGDPLAYSHWPGLFHVVGALAMVVLYLMRLRRQPPVWAAVVVLSVLPSMVLGVVGLARYTVLAFPMAFAAADVLTTRRRWPAVAFLSASAAAMLFLAVMINVRSWLP